MKEFPEWLTMVPAILGHRGGAALGDENSLEVMQIADYNGADAVEIDVQELGDGEVVLLHDAYLMVGEAWHWVRDLSRARLQELGCPTVTLDGLLNRLSGTQLGLYLEVKAVSPRGVSSIVDQIIEHELDNRVVIASFRHDVTAQVARDGRIASSALFRERFADPLALALDLRCQVVHPCFDGNDWMIDLMRGVWIDRLHQHGLKIVGWNSNDRAVLQNMADAGLDVLCTDDPRIWRS